MTDPVNEVELEAAQNLIKSNVQKDTLCRMKTFSTGIDEILVGLKIDHTSGDYAGLFQSMLTKCENAYHEDVWKTLNQ